MPPNCSKVLGEGKTWPRKSPSPGRIGSTISLHHRTAGRQSMWPGSRQRGWQSQTALVLSVLLEVGSSRWREVACGFSTVANRHSSNIAVVDWYAGTGIVDRKWDKFGFGFSFYVAVDRVGFLGTSTGVFFRVSRRSSTHDNRTFDPA